MDAIASRQAITVGLPTDPYQLVPCVFSFFLGKPTIVAKRLEALGAWRSVGGGFFSVVLPIVFGHSDTHGVVPFFVGTPLFCSFKEETKETFNTNVGGPLKNDTATSISESGACAS